MEQEIPRHPEPPQTPAGKPAAGPVAKARAEVPRKAGESRQAWKNRVFDHLRKKANS